MKKAISKVLNNDLCTGCGICSYFSDEIKITVSPEGYNRPDISSVRENPELEKKFNQVCPGINLDISKVKKGNYDGIWGQIESVDVGYSSNAELRQSGSSGGVISALSDYLVKSGIVDFVINISQGLNLDNVSSLKDKSYNFCESAGSRYSPASPCELISKLDLTKKYAFVGKPCDVAAVYRLKQQDPLVEKSITHLLSFMCAGTPSLKGTEEIYSKLGVKKENVKSMRYRGNGWPGYTTVTSDQNEEFSMTYNKAWGGILNRHLQTRCKLCVDGIGEFADIVCADAWDCDENGYPLFEENDGRSLVISRNKVGNNLLREAQSASKINLGDFDLNTLDKVQPFQFYRRVSIFSRLLAFRFLGLSPPNYKGFGLLSAALKGGIYLNIKSFFGLVARRRKIIRKKHINGID
jgi:coenzyme F420-reducing hydrogenase beta subunit